MKTEDVIILGLVAMACVLIVKTGKTGAATSGTKYTSAPITAANPYGINGWESVPWNSQTEIPMQPGGGY